MRIITFLVSHSILILFLFTPVSAQDTLTVMTYNIYHGEASYNRGTSNLEDIARLIRELEPDLVALQEVDSLTGRSAALNGGEPLNQVQYLANRTGMHGYFGKAIDFDGGGYGEGILTRHPLQSRKIMLPIPRGGERRALLTVEYRGEQGSAILFGGTHLCHQYPANRLDQAKKIRSHLSTVDTPYILGGDLNFTPQDPPYEILSGAMLDAAKLAGDPRPTYSYREPDTRIDYLFVSKSGDWELLEYDVLNYDYSDHMPVVMKVVLR